MAKNTEKSIEEKVEDFFKKQKRKVAKISKHVANQLKDYLHKFSNGLTSKYDLISVETLS